MRRLVSASVVGGLLMAGGLLVAGCTSRYVPADLQQKIDSLKKREALRQAWQDNSKMQYPDNPLQAFYDSLNIQPLPLRYSSDYVKLCTNFKSVPYSIATLFDMEGRTDTRAISLPERPGVTLMLVAGFDIDGISELWLYSLDADYWPVDKMCLYDVGDGDESDFSITSDYEIYRDRIVYRIGEDREIVEEYLTD